MIRQHMCPTPPPENTDDSETAQSTPPFTRHTNTQPRLPSADEIIAQWGPDNFPEHNYINPTNNSNPNPSNTVDPSPSQATTVTQSPNSQGRRAPPLLNPNPQLSLQLEPSRGRPLETGQRAYTQDNEDLQCEHCNKTYRKLDALRAHIVHKHSKN